MFSVGIVRILSYSLKFILSLCYFRVGIFPCKTNAPYTQTQRLSKWFSSRISVSYSRYAHTTCDRTSFAIKYLEARQPSLLVKMWCILSLTHYLMRPKDEVDDLRSLQ